MATVIHKGETIKVCLKKELKKTHVVMNREGQMRSRINRK